jgi:hypothetical protein
MLPAFPGADGAAANVTGGRGGVVYHVTRRDVDYTDVTPGTLRYGLSQLSGPRTIVFDVGGVFSLGRPAVSGWDANGNGWDTASRLDVSADVTIAGQTAPGPVIIMGGTVKPGATNIIIRNITFAPGYGNRSFNEPTRVPVAGDFPDSYVYDALDISGQNVMIDHITAVYGTDETVSMNELANNVTVQYCNISQGQNYPQADAEASGISYTGHALGSLLQAGSNSKISVLHNLYAHLKGRLPRVGTEATALTVAGVGAYNDFRNNVFYNWLGTAGTGASGQASQNNFINNFYLAGKGGDDPVGGTSTALQTVTGGTAIFSGSDATLTKVFHSGNVKDTNKDADADDAIALTNADFASSAIQTAAFTQTPYLGVTDTAAVAFSRVLDFAGSIWWNRSALDARIINEVRTGTGRIMAWADDPFNASTAEGAEWRSLISTPPTTRPAGFDTDNDGMPDTWEMAHGLNPNVADNNGDFDNDGYTNIEEYINEIAAWPAPVQTLFRAVDDHRYARIQNWLLEKGPRGQGVEGPRVGEAAYWQPSRYDVAQIRYGKAVVDAVGQHAGTLQVAGSSDAARLEVTSGWIQIEDELDVGGFLVSTAKGRRVQAGEGVVEQSGGRLTARHAIVIGGPRGSVGAHSLSGGELTTPLLARGEGKSIFQFTGGRLHAGVVAFDLVDDGGIIAPGEGIGHTEVLANLTMNRGALEIEIDGSDSDTVAVSGVAHLGGALHVEPRAGFVPRAGDSWTVLMADGGIVGEFDSVPAGYAVRIAGNRLVLTFDARCQPVATAATPGNYGAASAATSASLSARL